MHNRNIYSEKQSLLIDYLVRKYKDGELNLPSIQEMSQELGISVSSLREQLGVISGKILKNYNCLLMQQNLN
jgi:AraC-like DNA-binding protein